MLTELESTETIEWTEKLTDHIAVNQRTVRADQQVVLAPVDMCQKRKVAAARTGSRG